MTTEQSFAVVSDRRTSRTKRVRFRTIIIEDCGVVPNPSAMALHRIYVCPISSNGLESVRFGFVSVCRDVCTSCASDPSHASMRNPIGCIVPPLQLAGNLSYSLPEESLARNRIIDLFHKRRSLLEGRGRVEGRRRLFFESVDGRGQETIRHFGRRLDALAHGFGQIPFEIGKEKSAHGFGNKGRGHCRWDVCL